ncbi:MAG TPA: JAB domain-containing protein [Chroococcales cyanobacterium]
MNASATANANALATADLLSKMKYRLPKMRLCLVSEAKRPAKTIVIESPTDAAKFLAPLKHASEEHFVSLHLNAKHEVIGLHEVSHGTLSASLVHPREVFKAAIVANSYAMIVCHNHPSGAALTPSLEDIETTKQLLSAGKILGISVVDHLIVSPAGKKEEIYSLRENYPHLWNQPPQKG